MPAKAESPGSLVRTILSRQLEALGFFAQGFLSARSFQAVLDEEEVSTQIRERYGTDKSPSLAAVALNYSEGPDTLPAWAAEAAGAFPASLEPLLTVAHFARANWYAEIDRRLAAAVRATRFEAAAKGIEIPDAKAWKRLVNSGLPEKALSLRAGLGWIGKNTILIASGSKGTSSAVLLGLLLCPIDLEPAEPAERRSVSLSLENSKAGEPGRGEGGLNGEQGCGNCRRCVQACPTGALGSQGYVLDRRSCIQHWTHIDEAAPAKILPFLSGRLYGCDSCLEACPYFVPDQKALCMQGILGKAIPARSLLAFSEAGLKTALRGTALDRSWISLKALRRNAALSLETGRNEGADSRRESKENVPHDH
ncbi:MAG: 4Fe-4S double cluster binding domain-containing protein [Spirochaetales bacterium]|nr:4Fe-4S double cluster binding domain-containing protein [Spirochaetales bacterium]